MENELLDRLESLLREVAACGSREALEAARAVPSMARGGAQPLPAAAIGRSLDEVYAWIDGVSEPLARRLAAS